MNLRLRPVLASALLVPLFLVPARPARAQEGVDGVATGLGNRFQETQTALTNDRGVFEAVFMHRFLEEARVPVREASGDSAAVRWSGSAWTTSSSRTSPSRSHGRTSTTTTSSALKMDADPPDGVPPRRRRPPGGPQLGHRLLHREDVERIRSAPRQRDDRRPGHGRRRAGVRPAEQVRHRHLERPGPDAGPDHGFLLGIRGVHPEEGLRAEHGLPVVVRAREGPLSPPVPALDRERAPDGHEPPDPRRPERRRHEPEHPHRLQHQPVPGTS